MMFAPTSTGRLTNSGIVNVKSRCSLDAEIGERAMCYCSVGILIVGFVCPSFGLSNLRSQNGRPFSSQDLDPKLTTPTVGVVSFGAKSGPKSGPRGDLIFLRPFCGSGHVVPPGMQAGNLSPGPLCECTNATHCGTMQYEIVHSSQVRMSGCFDAMQTQLLCCSSS